jgi:hypothetical protein
VSLKTVSRSCFARTLRPRSNGNPESISVANCRVKIIMVFGLTFLRWKRTMLIFVRGRAGRAAFAAARETFPSGPPLPSS